MRVAVREDDDLAATLRAAVGEFDVPADVGVAVETVAAPAVDADPGTTAPGDADADGNGNEDADATPQVDLLVVCGESGRTTLAAPVPSVPTLSVDGPGPLSVPRSALPAAVAAHARGETWTVPHPVLAATLDGDRVGTAVADVSLMTAEPARISEYAVAVDPVGGRNRGDRDDRRAGGDGTVPVDGFRADGVVVATPLGSAGYGRDAGGPLLGSVPGLAVVPVAPFTTDPDAYVVPPDVHLTVERDDTGVTLLVDDREVTAVDPGDVVRVATAATFPLVRPPGAHA